MRVRWKPGNGVATPLMTQAEPAPYPAHRAGTPAAGRPVVHLHTVRNGKIDSALHDGCAQASASSTGTGSSPAALPNHQLPSLQRLNRTVASRHRKAVVVIWRKQHHQFRGESRNTSRALAITPLTSSSTSCAGSNIPPAASGKDSEDKRAYQATFRQKRRHQGGSASLPTPVYSRITQSLRNGGGGNKAIRAHPTSEALCCANQLRRRPCVSPRVVRRRGYPVRYEFALPAPPNEACAQRAPLLDLLVAHPPRGLHPQPITAKFAPIALSSSSRRRFPA